MIVADTNLIAYLLIPGERTEFAQAVLRKDSAWGAPLLWRSEFRNVLALYLRQELFSLPDALQYMEAAEELMPGREIPRRVSARAPVGQAVGLCRLRL